MHFLLYVEFDSAGKTWPIIDVSATAPGPPPLNGKVFPSFLVKFRFHHQNYRCMNLKKNIISKTFFRRKIFRIRFRKKSNRISLEVQNWIRVFWCMVIIWSNCFGGSDPDSDCPVWLDPGRINNIQIALSFTLIPRTGSDCFGGSDPDPDCSLWLAPDSQLLLLEKRAVLGLDLVVLKNGIRIY